jgi:hypothetical protein
MNRAGSQPASKAASTKEANASQPKRRSHRSPGRRASTLGTKTSAEANRRAAVILTVLAGERLPSEAAEVLGISVTHYYILERKALQGLLGACERKPQGPPGPTAEQQIVQLERQLEQARRQCQRQAALVRSTQRALGLPATSGGPPGKAKSKSKSSGDDNGKSAGRKRRRRQPTVRALRAAETLARNSPLSNSTDELQQASAVASTPSSTTAQEGR